MARILLVVNLLVFLFQGNSAPAEDEQACILKGIQERYQGLPGISVPYTREVISRSMSMLGSGVKGDLAEGHIYFKPPYFLRLEQETPKHETLVTDGHVLWWHIPDQNRVYQYPFQKFGQEMRLLSDLFRGLTKVEDNFKVSMRDKGPKDEYQIELKPDPPWEQIDRIGLMVSKEYLIQEVDIQNEVGGITRFKLLPFTVKDLREGFFRFLVPKGVELIKED